MLANALKYAKGHVAVIGAAATWIVATYPNGQAAHVAAAVLAVLTAAGVYLVPNKVKPARRKATAKPKP